MTRTIPFVSPKSYSTFQKSPSSSKPSSRLGSVCSRIKSSLESELRTPTQAKDNGSSREQICSPTTSSESSSRKQVSFQHVEIRNYDVTLGKHLNEYDLGPAITLDWSYHDENEKNNKVTVDEYEKERLPSRRSKEDLFALSRLEREEILQKQGFHKSVLDKVTQSNPIRKQR